MDIPRFIQKPPSKTVMETARLLACDKTMKQIADLRNLSYETIKDHTRILRFLFHTDKTRKAIKRMLVLRYLPIEVLDEDFPGHWQQYMKRDQPKG